MNELVIGIDGGGTRTRAQLANLEGAILGKGEAGASNPLAHGMESAQRELEAAIANAFESARIQRQRAAALVMGLGGASQTQEQTELQGWARERFADHVAVVHDGEILLAAGTSEHWGIALVAGTGSLAWGRNRAGKTARAGGWGYLLGDEGSGFDLARQALRAATQFADGRGEPTHLLEQILTFWNLAEPNDLLPKVYRSGLTHQDIAKLAPIVLQTAEMADDVALNLVHQAADSLVRAVVAVSRALHIETESFPLAVTGGLVLHSAFLQSELHAALRKQNCHASPIEWVPHPVAGAVRLAITLAVLHK
jgi:N-acetylglucosamine kinase-like BadF-type ATPase